MKPVLPFTKSLVITLLAATLGVGFPRLLLSQATFGNIIGTVTDPGGAVIVGAKVTITSVERGTVISTTSNESGNYIQTHLGSGKYNVEFETAGFQRLVKEGVEVSVDRSTRVDAQMVIGEITKEVTVTGEAPALVTDRAEVSVTLSL